MRYFVLAACIAAASPAPAQDGGLCKDYGNRAEEIMRMRQDNVPMSTVMGYASIDLLKELVMLAYREPLMVFGDKNMIIAKFRNDREFDCYTAFNKGKKKP
ncbi:hypothetical protein [Pseudotabrizicola sp. 4114]|uniref:hypothetical protein n=1 Tax=Pseudotabrizicola sp. 4114 TaxID=2817731 RepID=UPI00285E6460|nr:hypothetical protein [Pseudorhodobacter sp. 4114]